MDVKFSNLNGRTNSAVPLPQAGPANLAGQQHAAQEEPNPDLVPHGPAQADAAPAAARPAQGSVRGLGAKLNLVDLPKELLDKVLSHLPAQDVCAVSCTDHAMRSATRERRVYLKCANTFSRKVSLVSQAEPQNRLGFLQRALALVDRLPSDLRTEPLRQVMLHLHALPPEHRAQAITQFRQAVSRQNAPDRLPELPRLENVLSYRTADEAADHGENLAVVASAFGITGELQVWIWESLAAQSNDPNTAGVAMLAGGTVPEVAARFGYTTSTGFEELELRTIRSDAPNTAGAFILAGSTPKAVAAQFGITSHNGIRALEYRTISSDVPGTAGAAVLAGENVQAIVDRFGITTPEGIRHLEFRQRGLI